MLKRFLAAAVAMLMLLSVCACGKKGPVSSKTTSTVSDIQPEENGSDNLGSDLTGDNSDVSGLTSGDATSEVTANNSKPSAGNTSSKSQATASIPDKTSDSAQMVDPGFLDGVDPFKDPVFKENVTNLKGKTIKIGTFWPNNYKSSNSDPVAQANVKAIAAIQKEYNCTIKMVYMDANSFLSDVATTTASGKVYADIYEIQGEMGDLYKNGYFADLSKVSSVGLKTNGWSPASIANATYKNTCYGVGLEKYIGYSVVYFNKALASKYKVGDLYSLVDKGQWTWSKFRSVSGNGV